TKNLPRRADLKVALRLWFGAASPPGRRGTTPTFHSFFFIPSVTPVILIAPARAGHPPSVRRSLLSCCRKPETRAWSQGRRTAPSRAAHSDAPCARRFPGDPGLCRRHAGGSHRGRRRTGWLSR